MQNKYSEFARRLAMPLVRGRDTKGAYYRWGPAGHGGAKHHYTAGNKTSRERARAKAMTQARAIERSKHMRGGAAPKRPRRKTLSSTTRAQKKVADKGRVKKVATYRRSARGSAAKGSASKRA